MKFLIRFYLLLAVVHLNIVDKILSAEPAAPVRWVQRIGGPASDGVGGIAADRSGNVYVAGAFSGTIQVGSNTLTSTGNSNSFVAKFNRAGNLAWVLQGTGASNVVATSIALDPGTNVYIAGFFRQSMQVGGVTLTNAGVDDLFLVKLNPAGVLQWAIRDGGTGIEQPRRVGVDAAGNSYLSGPYTGNVRLAGVTLTNAGFNDFFMVKYGPTGSPLWAIRSGGASSFDTFGGFAVSPSGESVLVGRFAGTANFGSSNVTATSSSGDIFISKFDAAGAIEWVAKPANVAQNMAYAAEFDSASNIVICGNFQLTLNFNTNGGGTNTTITSAGILDTYVARYTPTGVCQWARRGGGAAFDYGQAVWTDERDEVYMTGYFSGPGTFGTSNFPSLGDSDCMLVKYSTNGSFLWAKEFGGASNDQGYSGAADRNGNIYVGGMFSSPNAMFDSITLAANVTNDIFIARLEIVDTNGPPVIITEPEDKNVLIGTNFQLMVSAGGLAPLLYQWFHDDVPVPSGVGAVLNFGNAQLSDAGGYRVEISNAVGIVTTSRVATVVVEDPTPPTVTMQPVNQTVLAGGTAMFSTIVQGSSPLVRQWYFVGAPLPAATNSALTITNVQPAHMGDYWLVVTNNFGNATTLVATLTVDAQSPPVILQQPGSHTGYLGHATTFRAMLQGLEPMQYQWFHGGAAILGGTNALLTIPGVQDSDAGSYFVAVTNAAGATSSVAAVLTVEPAWWAWTRRGGGVAGDEAVGAAINVRGETIVAGLFRTNANFGVSNLSASGTSSAVSPDLFLASYDSLGNLNWLRRDGNSNLEYTRSMALDGEGNILIGGYYSGQCQLAGNTLNTSNGWGSEAFIAKYDRLGNGRWARSLNSPGTELVRRVAADPWLNVVAAAEFAGNLTIPVNGTIGSNLVTTSLTSAGSTDVALLQYSPTGTLRWVQRLGGVGTESVRGLAVDGVGNIYVAGSFSGLFGASGSNVLSHGNYDLFLVKYSPEGTLLWATAVGGTSYDDAAGLAVDATGRVVLAGTFQGSMTIAGTNLVSAGASDVLLVCFDSDGTPIWAQRGGSAGNEVVRDVTVDPWGRVRVVGEFVGTTTWANSNITALGINDVFVAELDMAGNFLLLKRGGDQDRETPQAIGSGPDGRAVVAGLFYNQTSYSGATNFSAGDSDAFVALLETQQPGSAPVLATAPIPVSTFQGQAAAFNVRVAGSTPMSLQWYRNDVAVAGATNQTLLLTNIQPALAGAYSVVATNALGQTSSLSVLLEVAADTTPIVITQAPADRVVALGGGTTFSVTAVGPAPLSYQWSLDTAPLSGATNAQLVITNATVANAGLYSVLITNYTSATSSPPAVLSVNGQIPAITQPPQSTSVVAGANVTFNVGVSGTPPLLYQWRFNGTAIAGATSSQLNLTGVQLATGGAYSVVVSNAFGSATSASAYLSVQPPPSVVRVAPTNGSAGSKITVPVELVAQGVENAVGFSLQFDPALLAYVSATPVGQAGAASILNSSQALAGRVGFLISLPISSPTGSSTFASGVRRLYDVVFNVLATNAGGADLLFSDAPVLREVVDPSARPVSAVFVNGTVPLNTTNAMGPLEGDVSPRTTGNGLLSAADWVQMARFLSRRDVPGTNEFQRADCAPLASRGDGRITTADWVQVGRFAAGLDLPITAGGPTGTNGASLFGDGSGKSSSSAMSNFRTVRVRDGHLQPGEINAAVVELVGVGDENALGFTLNFDPAKISVVSVAPGAAVRDAVLDLNTNNLAGTLAVALGLPAGTVLDAGTNELLQLEFQVPPWVSGFTQIGFGDAVTPRETAGMLAEILPTTFVPGALDLNFTFDVRPEPYLQIDRSNAWLILSWPSTAVELSLEQSPAYPGPVAWSNAPGSTNLVGATNRVVLPDPGDQFYFRLRKP